MKRSISELKTILKVLVEGEENVVVEFKRAENDFDIDKLGKYFSAIKRLIEY